MILQNSKSNSGERIESSRGKTRNVGIAPRAYVRTYVGNSKIPPEAAAEKNEKKRTPTKRLNR